MRQIIDVMVRSTKVPMIAIMMMKPSLNFISVWVAGVVLFVLVGECKKKKREKLFFRF